MLIEQMQSPPLLFPLPPFDLSSLEAALLDITNYKLLNNGPA